MSVIDYMKLKTLSQHLTYIYIVLVWFLFSLLYSHLQADTNTSVAAGYLILIGGAGLDAVAVLLTLYLWKFSIDRRTKSINLFFLISFIAALTADSIYNITLNLTKFQYNKPLIDVLFDTPFAAFLILQTIAWSYILNLNKKSETIKKDNKITYTPYVFVSIIMFFLFMFGLPWKIGHTSLLGIFQTSFRKVDS